LQSETSSGNPGRASDDVRLRIETEVDRYDGGNKVDTTSNITSESVGGLFQSSSTGNYRLLPTSAARNAGKLTYLAKSAPSTDLSGNPRRTAWTVAAGAFE